MTRLELVEKEIKDLKERVAEIESGPKKNKPKPVEKKPVDSVTTQIGEV